VWSAPVLLLVPAIAFVLLLGGVRGRRTAATLAQLAAVLTLLDVLLIAWALARRSSPYSTSYQWFNIPVSPTGDPRFQGFGIDLAIRVDHYALAALLALLAVFLACLFWRRIVERAEPGPVRYHAAAMLLLLCAVGVVVSGDIAEQLGFWIVAGVASWLLLSQRWGTEGYAGASWSALALPAPGDLALLCAVAILYSRYASLDLSKIAPALHTTAGVGLKTVTAVALLVLAAVVVRAGVWPFSAWLTAATGRPASSVTAGQPASSIALVGGVWPALAGIVLLRYLPLFQAAGPQAPVVARLVLGVAAVLGPALALLSVDLRRSLLLASSGALALGLLGVLDAASSPAGLTGVLGVGLGRAAAVLAAASACLAMRTWDARETGGAWRLMRGSALGLLIAAGAVGFGAAGAAASGGRSPVTIAFAAGLVVASAAAFRVYVAVAHGPLRRRRAFEPGRVREAPRPSVVAALMAALVALAAAALAFTAAWLALLGGGRHALDVRTDVLWLLPAVAGLAAAWLAFFGRKEAALGALAEVERRGREAWEAGCGLYERLVARPGLEVVRGVEMVGLPEAELGVGRALVTAGAMLGRSLPWVVSALVVGVVAALVVGAFEPGLRG
jgi:NADH:ubiquinone oxidoreductase subunit 5 (subunit L)/multisubunit Na+/H+ antiporter MnhA subunit